MIRGQLHEAAGVEGMRGQEHTGVRYVVAESFVRFVSKMYPMWMKSR